VNVALAIAPAEAQPSAFVVFREPLESGMEKASASATTGWSWPWSTCLISATTGVMDEVVERSTPCECVGRAPRGCWVRR
jgi:hypothetical protein